ncbi:MAG: hypothetical protein E2590_09115 [Chryseobacterium sp.]|nr:hypothetical protein [Chryseobacterium sp.]
MPKTATIDVKNLKLDLKNYRTVPQTNEKDAIKAMIAISSDRFFAVLDSIVEDGYTPTENIVVLKENSENVVKEGNRRIACLKLIQGQYTASEFNIPTAQLNKILALNKDWKKENDNVPCLIFEKNEENKCDKLISLTHGKGEKASREKWSSVATARHNRDAKGAAEPALDLLESYLISGNNLTNQQKERWAGDYPLTVLAEALRILSPRLGYANSTDMANAYPKIKGISKIEDMLRDIGLEQIQFKTIRDTNTDFASQYGVAPIVPASPVSAGNNNTPASGQGNTTSNNTATASGNTGSGSTPSPTASVNPNQTTNSQGNTSSNNTSSSNNNTGNAATSSTASSTPAYAINDPRRVKAILKKFIPTGNRSKVVTLRNEMHSLNLQNNPIAFCFLLRSIFEISAKSYCIDNSIPTTKTNGGRTIDLTLLETLKAAYKHLTGNGSDTNVVKNLHGAWTEISKSNGILSVTSLNRLVHDPNFAVTPADVCVLFGNVYPLLEYMN